MKAEAEEDSWVWRGRFIPHMVATILVYVVPASVVIAIFKMMNERPFEWGVPCGLAFGTAVVAFFQFDSLPRAVRQNRNGTLAIKDPSGEESSGISSAFRRFLWAKSILFCKNGKEHQLPLSAFPGFEEHRLDVLFPKTPQ